MKELKVEARMENLEKVLQFLDQELEEMGCGIKAQMQLDIAVEEIFVNIVHYAYAPGTGFATIRIEREDNRVSVTFMDSGVPYNPLEKADPDVTLSAEEREIGGLGIFMVKKSMDLMHYEYRNGMNILKLYKKM